MCLVWYLRYLFDYVWLWVHLGLVCFVGSICWLYYMLCECCLRCIVDFTYVDFAHGFGMHCWRYHDDLYLCCEYVWCVLIGGLCRSYICCVSTCARYILVAAWWFYLCWMQNVEWLHYVICWINSSTNSPISGWPTRMLIELMMDLIRLLGCYSLG